MIDLLNTTVGTLIVFEGLDRAGKSTQIERLKGMSWEGTIPRFVHMPSGLTSSTEQVRDILEKRNGGSVDSPLARQLFHLGCHAETSSALQSSLRESAVFLDRFWWSTFAYGWYGGHIDQSGLTKRSFMNLIETVWENLEPELVFLFLRPHDGDSNNNDAVSTGYRVLASQFSNSTAVVPDLSVEDTTTFIIEELIRRKIAK